jgi:threonine/homoserine/homoserine lactone efflux protein
MANEASREMELQLAMAFGQGTGTMMANPEALTFALSEQKDVISRAAGDWAASKYALFELVRLVGQIAAVHAAHDVKAEIQITHVKLAIPAALDVCPCLVKSGM